MRVLHVIPSVSPLRGGPSKAVFQMVQALRQEGVDASILTTNDDGPGLDRSLPLGRWCEREGVPLLAFARWSPPLAPLREFAISPGLSRWLGRHLRAYDLLHVHAIFSYPSTWSMRQARQAGVPYLVRTIGQLSPWSLAQSRARKQWMLRLLERRNLEGAAAVHFTSRAEREEAAALALRAPAMVLPLGVRGMEALADGELAAGTEGAIGFLYLSRLHPKKRLERLLEALAIVRRQRPQARWSLTIAGSGAPAYGEELRRLAARLGLEGQCRWLGHVEGEAKQRELRRADWFVLPSAAENFGIAVAEALACGVPAIVSPEVAVSELVEEAGAGLVCASDPPVLAATLMEALAGPSAVMRRAARELAEERLSWGAIAAELHARYAAILGRS